MPTRITKRTVDALNPGDLVWDQTLPGFGARCLPSGIAVFVLKYRVGGGRGARQRWYTIGRHGAPWTVEEARGTAKRLLGEIESGDDPSGERQKSRKDISVLELGRRFLADHVGTRGKARTKVEYQALLDNVIAPAIGRVKASELGRSDVARMHHVHRNTPYHANRARAVLSAMFNWGIQTGLVPDMMNPCRYVKKYAERKRERFLSDAELARVGVALREGETTGLPIVDGMGQATGKRTEIESPFAIAALRLLVLTGCRRDEILTLKWEHVDFEQACLRLPDSKTGAKIIRLNAPALEILNRLPRINGMPYVIAGRKEGSRLIGLRRVWVRVAMAAGLYEDLDTGKKDRAGKPVMRRALKYRLHDLRHSFASVGAGAGLGLPIIGALLGHTQAATTARYAHLADDPLRQASDAIGRRIDAAMKGSNNAGAEIVPFQKAGAT